MGTTLTGLTPATTYDALIKVGDNGPLSATAKYVGDGLGNDSVVALSTSSVGIGTTSPTQLLHVAGNVRITGALYDGNNAAGTSGQILSSTGTGTDWIDVSSLGVVDGSGTANYVSKWSDPNTLTNSVIYDNGTNVGIGTATPNTKLTVFQSGASGIATMDISGGGTGAGALQISAGRVLGTTSFDLIQNNAGAFINQRDNNPLGILVNGSERLSITASGNVGIGTSSPAELLHLSTTLAGSTGVGTAIQITSGGTGGDQAFIGVNKGAGNGLELSVENRDIIFNTGATTPFGGTERLRITSAGNVGIGTSSPAYKLQINASGGNGISLLGDVNNEASVLFGDSGSAVIGRLTYSNIDDSMRIFTNGSERVRIDSSGNVGIGTSSPSVKLDVAGQVKAAGVDYHTFSVASSSAQIRLERTGTSTGVSYIGADDDGLKVFNSSFSELARIDSSGNLSLPTGSIALSGSGAGIFLGGSIGSANGLDDYEEGTWTPTISFGGASTGVTYAAGRAGQYTKIGRQVTVTAYILLTSKGSSTGAARIGGLPFTIANASGYYAAGSLGALADITYGGQIQTYAEINTTNYVLNDYSEAGVQGNITDADFANTSQILFTATYFVS